MTLIDKACYERGCACYDPRVDRDGVEVVQREWVGLTDKERTEIRREHYARTLPLMDAVEAKLKEKNT
jgi:hypothetical protein